MRIRGADASDAAAISEVLEELIAAGRRTKPSDEAFVLAHYIQHPHRLRCNLAQDDDGAVLGFQSLKIADDMNPYGTPVGWGIIGTHVRPSAARKGIGSALFAATVEAAREARLPAIEASIGDQNATASAYYEAMGFRAYRRSHGLNCKALYLAD